jgi:hypothetical protein
MHFTDVLAWCAEGRYAEAGQLALTGSGPSGETPLAWRIDPNG